MADSSPYRFAVLTYTPQLRQMMAAQSAAQAAQHGAAGHRGQGPPARRLELQQCFWLELVLYL